MALLIGVVVAMVLLGMFFYMRFYEVNALCVKHIDVPANVSEPFTIVHFSDTHFKANFDEKAAQKVVQAINEIHADFIVFSGDLMDHYAKTVKFKDTLPPILNNLQAKIEKLAVYGNHDIGGKAKYVYADMMKASGFLVLRNERKEYQDLGIAFYGIDDARLGYEDRNLCPNRLQPFQLLISHEPDIIDQMEISNLDMVVCGHTHGGQVALPFFKNKVLPKGGKHYRKGFYQINTTKLFVSSGIGTTKLSFRFHNLPEILVYHLKPM